MPAQLKRLLTVAARVLQQLRHDHRFLALSLVAPLVVILVVKVFIDAMESPPVEPPAEAIRRLIDDPSLPPPMRERMAVKLREALPPEQESPFQPTRFAVPLGAFIVHLITYLLCAIVLVRERSAQTLARMFVSGYRQAEIIGGYIVAYTALATLQCLLVLVELSLLFTLDFSLATLASIYLVVWLLAVTSVALGILVSNFARTEGQVLPFIPLVAVPSILLSGVIVPISSLPDWAQWLSYVTPLYYANNVLQELIQSDGTLADAWTSLAALPLYGLVVLFLASRTLREIE